MRFNIYNLLSLSILVTKQIIQSNAQGVGTTKTVQNAQPAQNGIQITDEQLKTFSFGKEEFSMAIIGDSGAEKESREVMKLAQYSALLHLGDYDYECSPNKYFDTTLDSNRSYQFMGILGNHEGVSECGKDKFDKYKSLLYNQMTNSKNTKVKCEFSSSKAMWVCLYKNVRIIGLSTEVNGADKRDEQLAFLKKHLNGATEDWKICSWHFYDKYYHTGKYPSDSERSIISGSGESFYDYCKDQGAIILSAHDHVYARTHVMSKFKTPVIDSYDKGSNGNIVQIRKGATLNILNGAGGYEMYIEQGQEKNYSHWQKKYAKGSNGENAKKYGGLFCNFNVGGNPKKASCQFLRINSNEKVFDAFTIYQNENPGTVKYTQIDDDFKNEKIKAYKLANNIVDPVAAATTTIVANIISSTPTNNVPSTEYSSSSMINNISDSPRSEGQGGSGDLINSTTVKIGGSICVALVVLGGGVFIFSNKDKKIGSDPEIVVDMPKEENNHPSNFGSYNFSTHDPYTNGGIDNSFAPLPKDTSFYQSNKSTSSYDYNTTYDRSFGKGNNYEAYTTNNLKSNAHAKDYSYYSTSPTHAMMNDGDTDPLVDNSYTHTNYSKSSNYHHW